MMSEMGTPRGILTKVIPLFLTKYWMLNSLTKSEISKEFAKTRDIL